MTLMDREIARLRAEVEQLTDEVHAAWAAYVEKKEECGRFKRERDEALRDYTELKKSRPGV